MPVMIFAAGLGTRMGDLVKDRPKPLVQVGQHTLLDHALSFVNIPALGRKVVNVHYKAEMVIDHLSDHDVLFSDERGELLETGGGLRKALPLLDSPVVATLNTDAVWTGPNPFETLLANWDADKMDALLLLAPLENVHGHPGSGDFILDEECRLRRGRGLVYTGAQIIKTDGLGDMPDGSFSLNLLWDAIADKSRLFGVGYAGQWCDVGRPSSIPVAEELLRSHV
jgi:MurNAc alpha-1-phosphate uridylyltransferase